jgi:hypothetical protein
MKIQVERLASIRHSLRNFHTWLMALPERLVIVALACAAMNLASDLSDTFGNAPRYGGPLVAWATLLAYLAFFALAVLAQSDPIWLRARLAVWGRWQTAARYAVLAYTLWTAAQSLPVIAHWPQTLASPHHYGSDELFYAQYNALLVLHGQNPYVGEHLAGALRHFGVENVTPLRTGAYRDPLRPPTPAQLHQIVTAYLANPAAPHPNLEPATTHSYPALSFLIAVPSVWAGLPTLGYAQVAALLALVAAIVALAPARLCPAVAALCLLTVDGWRSVAGSDFAIWTAAGIGLVWILGTWEKTNATKISRKPRKGVKRTWPIGRCALLASIFRDLRAPSWLSCSRPFLAAVALGLVCAVQQTAWFFAPFYLVWVWRRQGGRAALSAGATAVGAFLAINLPWIVMAPGPWLRSLLLPVTLPLFPNGNGLVGLALGGALPLWPSGAYTALELLAYAVLLAAYARWLPRAPLAGMVLPLAAVLLAWRSPTRYFILLPFVALLALVLTWRAEMATPPAACATARDQAY